MSNSTSAVPPPMTIFRSLPRPTKSKISVSDALGTSKTSLEVWFIFKSLFNFTSSTTVGIESTYFYDSKLKSKIFIFSNRKKGFSRFWLYFLWVLLKYPTNCFLCFNIKNVITFSVIFNNIGWVQSFVQEKYYFCDKNFEMSQNRSVTISLRAPLRTKNEISFALRNLSNSGIHGSSRPHLSACPDVLVRGSLILFFKYSDNPVSCHAQTH